MANCSISARQIGLEASFLEDVNEQPRAVGQDGLAIDGQKVNVSRSYCRLPQDGSNPIIIFSSNNVNFIIYDSIANK